MCLSNAGRVLAIENHGREAVVEVSGTAIRVSLAMMLLEGQPITTGDWVLVHTGFAIETLEPAEAAELTALHEEMLAATERSP
ncbi:MAG TPA: HypC/HybG/HupF family hydrogenase formation chaperone [Acidimicrobiia bacterium]|nr:HypC/HybG/HupF family hydrogenase formation chaperone [Acidimicrobiia bacterium]